MSDYCFRINEQYFICIMARTNYIRRDDNDVRCVLDQHAE